MRIEHVVRQSAVILHRIREVFSEIFSRSAEDLEMRVVYDVSHNTAKLERHMVDGKEKQLLLHRKGSTRAFGPGHDELPRAIEDRPAGDHRRKHGDWFLSTRGDNFRCRNFLQHCAR